MQLHVVLGLYLISLYIVERQEKGKKHKGVKGEG